ncbi:3-hydroxyacyl-CoA dehydrogenase NAD-binding domain-containing protein, partial [Ectobacillus funiculus]|uniref:3-hydroxyacyl-CoA dehydrogenase NAD-binding domain-containing protein n=1 Tax=Ectobacillus funiculus TaxID=137993 RepID=UPI001FE78D64
MSIYQQLLERERANEPIKVGVIGAGQMGFGMIAQISSIPGMAVTGISDINVEAAQRAADYYNSKAVKKEQIIVTNDFRQVIQSSNV